MTIFTSKDIQAGEELCFSYFGEESEVEEEEDIEMLKNKGHKKEKVTLLSSPVSEVRILILTASLMVIFTTNSSGQSVQSYGC